MKLLTFLGAGKYDETRYHRDGQEVLSRFAPLASARFLECRRVEVFLTQGAREAAWPDFERAARDASLEPVAHDIPDGRTEAELWDIFTRVAETVEEGEAVAFDVTHGLRSFPLLGLLVAAYLRAARGVELKAVLYGAYDVRQQEVAPSRTPVFDLGPMLRLLDWAEAAERFQRFGDARDLGRLLADSRKALAEEAGGQAAGAVGNLANALQALSLSLRLLRPYDVLAGAAKLPGQLDRAATALQARPELRPFPMLMEQVRQAYEPLGVPDPQKPGAQAQVLAAQRRLVGWYLEREQVVQAVALAREWLVSWALAHLGVADLRERQAREEVEGALGVAARARREGQAAFHPPLLLRALPQVEAVADLWAELGDLRNDLLHAGMRPDPREAQDLMRQAEGLIAALADLPLPEARP